MNLVEFDGNNERQMQLLFADACTFSDVSLEIKPDVSFADWIKIGDQLKLMHEAVLWWIGDWLNFGEKRYGETYAQALAATDYSLDALKKAKWISATFEKGRRRHLLTFAHHREVAPFDDANQQDEILDWAEHNHATRQQLRAYIRSLKIKKALAIDDAFVMASDYRDFLRDNPGDLLITDPPYATDVDDIWTFAHEWIDVALPMGWRRAYIFTGSYPGELAAYLDALKPYQHEVLVWAYNNTLGPAPSHTYKRNWQACFHIWSDDSPPLDCPLLVEQFAAQTISAPDGRHEGRLHAWEKPKQLAEQLIRHSTNPGDLVIDPFAGTGTFVAAAAALGRIGRGSENDEEMLALCEQRGLRIAR